MSPPFHASNWARTTSTFSCDIARAVSRPDRAAIKHDSLAAGRKKPPKDAAV